MSGALDPKIQQEIIDRDLYATAVLSGNRNFDGRIHPYAKQAFLASPPLVVAYAIAGTIRFDIEKDVLGVDADGKPVTLKDLWPSDEEIDAIVAKSVKPEQFRQVYDPMFAVQRRRAARRSARCTTGARRAPTSAVRRIGKARWPASARCRACVRWRCCRDNITTDHLSPSNAILLDSAAGEYLAKMGLPEEDFNSYATHRGDHLTAQRATFANPQLVNEMAVVDGKVKKGSLARIEPEGKVTRMWEAIETYMERKQPLIIIAGADYGQGSSRDWAAKGVRLAGVEAIVAEGFERIHRTNLIGMGVLPLEFKPGVNRKTLGIDGTETYDVIGERKPRADLTLVIHRQQRRARRSAGDLPPRYRRRSVDLRSRRRAAALRAGLPRIVARSPESNIMAHAPQIKIPATYMRGGTSKGVFFRLQDLPAAAQVPGAARDALLLRVIGSPDPYGKQIDGMGGATSSTSKTVIVSKSSQAGPRRRLPVRPGVHRQALRRLERQLRQPVRRGRSVRHQQRPDRCQPHSARTASATVRVWQANIGKTIIAHVPITNGAVQETGDFELDGVTFPAAEVQLEFIDPAADEEGGGRRDVPHRQSGR